LLPAAKAVHAVELAAVGRELTALAVGRADLRGLANSVATEKLAAARRAAVAALAKLGARQPAARASEALEVVPRAARREKRSDRRGDHEQTTKPKRKPRPHTAMVVGRVTRTKVLSTAAMRSSEPSESSRVPWAIPVGVAVVVGGLVVWRTLAGREDNPAPVDLEASASASTTASAAEPPAVPRCAEISPQPFVIGEPPKVKAPAPNGGNGAPDAVPDEPDDELAPFAVEIGRGAVYAGGFAAGVRRDSDGHALAMVAFMNLDGQGGRLVRLARSRGDLDPPVVTGAGDAVLVAMLEPNAGGRAIKIAKVKGDDVSWGLEFAEGRDESLALDVAASGERAVAVWDDVSRKTKRSNIVLASFDVATMRSVTPPRPVSAPKTDADSPRLVARPGGYWLGYLARAEAPAKDAPPPKKNIEAEDEEGAPPSGEAIASAWVEVMPLDESGAAVSPPRAVTPKDGHALAFDIELGEDGALIVAWRDDDTPTGSIGGRLSTALVRLGGSASANVVAEESAGAGVPDVIPGWLIVSGMSGVTRMAAMTPKGEVTSPLAPEPSLGSGEPIAAQRDAILLSRPAGRAMRLSVIRCAAGAP